MTAMKWISVKDKLPPINGCSNPVLIWIISRKTWVKASRYPDTYRSKKYHWSFYDIDGTTRLEPEEVSHWMPEPKPPIL